MQVSIQPEFIWSRDRVFAGTEQRLMLLVEWSDRADVEEYGRRGRRIIAKDVELRIWLEAHMTFRECHGCDYQKEEGGVLLLKLGKLIAGGSKTAVLEFDAAAMPAGVHEALWVQCSYRQPPIERIRELPLHKLPLEYSRHTGVLGTEDCIYVQKHKELLKTMQLMDELKHHRAAPFGAALEEKVRRQADQMLLLAARSADMQLAAQAEVLYKILQGDMPEQRGGAKVIGMSSYLR